MFSRCPLGWEVDRWHAAGAQCRSCSGLVGGAICGSGGEPRAPVRVGTRGLFVDLSDLLVLHAGGGLHPIHCQLEHFAGGRDQDDHGSSLVGNIGAAEFQVRMGRSSV